MAAIDDLQQALGAAANMMREVNPTDLARPTACADWDVKALANHMTSVCLNFARAASGESPEPANASKDHVGTDPATVYQQATQAAIEAWKKPGAIENNVTLSVGELPGGVAISINTVDQLLHTFDLARALGRPFTIDDATAEAALAGLRQLIKPERRGPGKGFGYEVNLPEGSSAQDRLLAFSGRQPH